MRLFDRGEMNTYKDELSFVLSVACHLDCCQGHPQQRNSDNADETAISERLYGEEGNLADTTVTAVTTSTAKFRLTQPELATGTEAVAILCKALVHLEQEVWRLAAILGQSSGLDSVFLQLHNFTGDTVALLRSLVAMEWIVGVLASVDSVNRESITDVDKMKSDLLRDPPTHWIRNFVKQ